MSEMLKGQVRVKDLPPHLQRKLRRQIICHLDDLILRMAGKEAFNLRAVLLRENSISKKAR